MIRRTVVPFAILCSFSLWLGCVAAASTENRVTAFGEENGHPITGTRRSSSGITLIFTGRRSPQVIIKDPRGKEVGHIAGLPDICGIAWSTDGRSFLIDTCRDIVIKRSTGLRVSWQDRVYAYSARTRKTRLISEDNLFSETCGRYLLIGLRKKMPWAATYKGIWPGVAYQILDAGDDFRVILRAGTIADRIQWSPDKRRFAFLDLAKDEYGEYANLVLTVADIPERKVGRILVTRRHPDFEWYGNDALAVVTYDKHAVPTLSLYALSGKSTKLATTPEYMSISLSYKLKPKIPGSIVYEASTSASQSEPDIWSVKPGSKPVRVSKKTDSRIYFHRRQMKGGMMKGGMMK